MQACGKKQMEELEQKTEIEHEAKGKGELNSALIVLKKKHTKSSLCQLNGRHTKHNKEFHIFWLGRANYELQQRASTKPLFPSNQR